MNDEIKRRINTLRNILVGKVPNPIEQVNQITNALLYKFMDDQDRLAESIPGGKKTFFIGGLKKYAWHKIVGDSTLSNQEKADLYEEGLRALSKNKDLPKLFQEIFKDALLPFRGADTIVMFLNEINKFDYHENPETIASAFEYVLSILSSQGDAGQFRTPYHIIKFIVDVVDPQMGEDIMDPACGTAGFLVEAYRHITQGKKLSNKDLKDLADKLHGVDIDPTMAKFARVNLYLHGFKSPDIKDDDTLSNEKLWGQKRDIFLANPPFMTPKGGIKPHDKFGVKANRSEVLFVDYIMENLKSTGRAGIIVPEGIIFKSENAYKKLRKMLVEDGLWAVVSLPAGVFQPYSGVKTSILFWDNVRAKEQKDILFIKAENDGYDLGAQRRPIDQNDLPKAVEILEKWKDGEQVDDPMALYVSRQQIEESGDYNLTGERYRPEEENLRHQKWEMVELGELEKNKDIEFLRGQGISKKDIISDGKYKCIHYGEIYTIYEPIIKNIVSRTNFDGKVKSVSGDVVVPATTTADALGIAVARSLNEDGVVIGGDINIIRTRNKVVLADYLALIISNPPVKISLSKFAKGVNILHLSNNDLRKLKIPLPPLEVQKQIVAEIEGYQKVIDGAKQVIENYKPSIKINPDWKMVELGEVIKTITPPNKIKKTDFQENGKYPIIDQSQDYISGYTNDEKSIIKIKKPLVIFGDHTCAVKLVETNFAQGADGIKIMETNDNLFPEFLYYFLLENNIDDGEYKRHFTKLKRVKVPLPPLEVQKQIVAEIEAEQKIVDANKKLIALMQNRIEKVISEI